MSQCVVNRMEIAAGFPLRRFTYGEILSLGANPSPAHVLTTSRIIAGTKTDNSY